MIILFGYIKFNESDFNRSIDWASHWIVLSIVFAELDNSEEAQALAVQSSGHMDSDNSGSYSVYFRPKYQFRKNFMIVKTASRILLIYNFILLNFRLMIMKQFINW